MMTIMTCQELVDWPIVNMTSLIMTSYGVIFEIDQSASQCTRHNDYHQPRLHIVHNQTHSFI